MTTSQIDKHLKKVISDFLPEDVGVISFNCQTSKKAAVNDIPTTKLTIEVIRFIHEGEE